MGLRAPIAAIIKARADTQEAVLPVYSMLGDRTAMRQLVVEESRSLRGAEHGCEATRQIKR